MSGKDRGRGVTHTSKKSLKGLTADECVLYSIMLKATKNGLKHWHKFRVCMRAVQRAVGRWGGRRRTRANGGSGSVVCWFPQIHPRAKERRQPPSPALRPPVRRSHRINRRFWMGWDDGMARWRRGKKRRLHGMPCLGREGGEGPALRNSKSGFGMGFKFEE